MALQKDVEVRLANALARVAPRFFARRLRNPVFLIGSGRSGTTMLRAVLATHRDIACYPNEANELWHPRLYPWHASDVDAPPLWVDPDRFTRVSLANRPRDWDLRVRAVFGAYQVLHRGHVFLNKSVMIHFMLPRILEIYPEARFIHLYRNGLAVARSYPRKERAKLVRNARYRNDGIRIDDESLFTQFVAYWSRSMQEIDEQNGALALTENGRLLEMRYETLCADPANEVRRVFEHLGLAPDAFDRSRLDGIRAMEPSATLRRRLTEIAKPALELKGYQPEEPD